MVLHQAVATQQTLAWLICTVLAKYTKHLAQVALELGALKATVGRNDYGLSPHFFLFAGSLGPSISA